MRLRKISLLFLAAVCLLMHTGCASILSESRYPVAINSSPDGAVVTVRDQNGAIVNRATTPALMMLPVGAGYFKKASYSFDFEKEGYDASTTIVSAQVDPWWIGNLVFGGLPGFLIVDPLTGSMWRMDQRIYGSLAQRGSSPALASGAPSATAATSPAAAPAGGVDASVVQQLKDLKELRDAGILSDAEYELKRTELVRRL